MECPEPAASAALLLPPQWLLSAASALVHWMVAALPAPALMVGMLLGLLPAGFEAVQGGKGCCCRLAVAAAAVAGAVKVWWCCPAGLLWLEYLVLWL